MLYRGVLRKYVHAVDQLWAAAKVAPPHRSVLLVFLRVATHAVINFDDLVGNFVGDERGTTSKFAWKLPFTRRASIRLDDRFELRKITPNRIARQDWRTIVPEWHSRRRPRGLNALTVHNNLYGWGEMNESRTLLTTLCKRKPDAIEFVRILGMHQVLVVTPGKTESRIPKMDLIASLWDLQPWIWDAANERR